MQGTIISTSNGAATQKIYFLNLSGEAHDVI